MLHVSNLQVCYGSVKAVHGIEMYIQSGELVALIGANGAGKTSTLKSLAGMLPTQSGKIEYMQKEITGMPSYQLVRMGIALVPEGRGIFTCLSVLENLQLGAYTRSDHASIQQDLTRIFQLFPRLLEREKQVAGTLSGGEQQMLAIGRALMSRPKLLLLDEPSMGLAPIMVQKIFQTIVDIAKQGVTILLVEQNARLALKVSQRAYVMENGRIGLSGNSVDLLADSDVQKAYLGG